MPEVEVVAEGFMVARRQLCELAQREHLDGHDARQASRARHACGRRLSWIVVLFVCPG